MWICFLTLKKRISIYQKVLLVSLLDPDILFLENLLREFECYKNGRIWLQVLFHPAVVLDPGHQETFYLFQR